MSRERRKLRKSSSMWIDCSLKITRHSKGHSIRCASQNTFLSPFLRCGDFLKTNNFFYHCTNSKPFSRRRVLTLFNIFYTAFIYLFISCCGYLYDKLIFIMWYFLIPPIVTMSFERYKDFKRIICSMGHFSSTVILLRYTTAFRYNLMLVYKKVCNIM